MKNPVPGTGKYDTVRGDAATGMKSFLTIAEYILEQHGPMEPFALADESLRLAHTPGPPEALTKAAARLRRTTRNAQSLSSSLLWSALATGQGLDVIAYPEYRLRTESRPYWLGGVGWASAAYKVLVSSKGYVGFRELFDKIVQTANFRFNPGCPQYQLYCNLADKRGKKLFSQLGTFRIGLERGKPQRIGPKPGVLGQRPVEASPMLQKIHEANLETLIAEDLNRVEQGLTLIGRQYTARPVGRIDLLCQDGKGNLVVIEIKRFGAGTESIIDQVTRYMGWVEEHLAQSGQGVRGIIVVGKPDVTLAYSARAVRNLSIMSVDLSLTAYSTGTQSVTRSRDRKGKTG